MFPPWEGSGVYAFGPLLLDLNRGWERWVPGRVSGLVDCSTEELFCLTARRSNVAGLVAFVGPRRCGDFAVGDSWQVDEVRTEVLAILSGDPQTPEASLARHGRQPEATLLLGDAGKPALVYEYRLGIGVTAVYHGLTSRPDLVADVRGGFDPSTLPPRYRFELTTFDRFAPCRAR